MCPDMRLSAFLHTWLQALIMCLPQGGQKRGRGDPDMQRGGKGATSCTWCTSLLTGIVCHPQMQQMYDMIMQHKRAMQDMQLLWEKALQQHQHGYDSDEEVDSELGTWEHQLRRMEMDKTRGGPRRKSRERGCLGSCPQGAVGSGSPTLLPRKAPGGTALGS